MARATAEFKGGVVSVHLYLNDTELRLTQNGKKWTGGREMGAKPVDKVQLRVTAPIGNEWALVVKLDKTKVLEKSDTMERQQFDETWTVRPKGVA